MTPTAYTLELTGEESKIEGIIELLRPFGIQEIVRTGKVAIARGPKTRLRKVEERLGKARDTARPAARRSEGGRVRGLTVDDRLQRRTPRKARRMPAKIYYDQDADLGLLRGKKIAIIGYGSQGHAHALNLKRLRPGRRGRALQGPKSWAGPRRTGSRWRPVADAAADGDVVMILLPDQTQRQVFEESIRGAHDQGQDADVRPRVQHPLQPGGAAAPTWTSR